MKKTFVCIIALALMISGCATIGNNSGREIPTFFNAPECPSFGNGRGVVADFIAIAPPQATLEGRPLILEGRPFDVALKFANYHKDDVDVTIRLQDTSGTNQFSVIEETATVEHALYSQRIISLPDQRSYRAEEYAQPGCAIVGEPGDPIEKIMVKDFFYTDIVFDETINFIADIYYDYSTELAVPLTICNPALRTGGCQAFTSQNLDSRDPVTITRIEQTLRGSTQFTQQDNSDVDVTLDIFVSNLGGGALQTFTSALDFQEFTFGITSQDDIGFRCISETLRRNLGREISVGLTPEGDAHITCYADNIPISASFVTPVIFDLSYPYHSRIITNPSITLKHAVNLV